MAELRILSGREVARILSVNGFVEVRRRGSHIVMQKQAADTTITVVVPDHKEIRVGTLASVIRQSQLPRRFFEK